MKYAVAALIGAFCLSISDLCSNYALEHGLTNLRHCFWSHGVVYALAIALAVWFVSERGEMVSNIAFPEDKRAGFASIIAGCFGFIIGFPALRVSGMYLGLTTMGFGFIIRRLIIALREWTQGSAGLVVSPPNIFGFTIKGDWANYFLVWTLAVLVIIGARRIVKSKIGRAFMAIRDSEQAAEASGINLAKYKMFSFFISGSLAGLSGVLMAHTNHFISTDHFDSMLSIYFIIMVLVGGAGTVYGAVLGTLFIVLLDNLFVPELETLLHTMFSIESGEMESFIFGLVMFLFIIFQPTGLYGMWVKIKIYWKLFPFNPKKTLFKTAKRRIL